MATEDQVKSKRAVIKGSITRIENFLTAFNPETGNPFELNVKEEQLRVNFQKYDECQSDLELIDINIYGGNREFMENKFAATLTKIKTLIKVVCNRDNAQGANPNSSIPLASTIKLPNIQVPTFNGKTDQWKTFYSLYKATIHSNANLDQVQRFYYLKSFLKDEPLNLINELELTAANYTKAIELLIDRYDNKLLNINYHLKSLLELPNVTKGTAANLREFFTNAKQHLNALKSLDLPTDKWDVLLVYLLSNKIDMHSHKSFKLERDASELPTFDEFIKHIEKRAQAFENVNGVSSFSNNKYNTSTNKDKFISNPYKVSHMNVNQFNTNSKQNTNFNSNSKTNNKQSNSITSTSNTNRFQLNNKKCSYCANSSHAIFSSQQFQKATIEQKLQFVESNKLCSNCLSNSHTLVQCTSRGCWVCAQRHHTILHNAMDSNSGSSTSRDNLSEPSVTSNAGVSLSNVITNQVLLATALINIQVSPNKYVTARCLLDSASQVSFITKALYLKLGVTSFKQNTNVFGISGNKTAVYNYAALSLFSMHDSNFRCQENCAIIEQITLPLPHAYINTKRLNLPSNLPLADKTFNIPGTIDMLLGASVYFNCIKPDIIHMGNNLPILQLTSFGYIIAGNISNNAVALNINVEPNCLHTVSNDSSQEIELNQTLVKFWQIEETPGNYSAAIDFKNAEKQFESSIYLNNNRFEVQLPFRDNFEPSSLFGSFNIALKRFKLLESRFAQNKELFLQYKAFIDEFVTLDHARYVNIDFNDPSQVLSDCYFLPHHPVFKVSSTTALRVVFDGSARTKGGKSLNECLIAAPPDQPDVFNLLFHFRDHKFVFTTDIKQMYRQILIAPEHTKFQRILWRDNPSDELKCIELFRVTYGTSSAPYMAVRTILHLANLFKNQYPLAANVLTSRRYIDDILGGCDDIQTLFQLKDELINMLKLGSFELHKWCSNSDQFINTIPNEKRESLTVHELKGTQVIKVLGMLWDPQTDILKFSDANSLPEKLTKRTILSYIAKFYDPLGIIGPLITPFKIYMQKLWCTKLTWDAPLSPELVKEWKNLTCNIGYLSNTSIPLWSRTQILFNKVELHGYSDASQYCYGAVIYLRIFYNDKSVSTQLIASKSRVSPLKKITLPRLELSGALLLSRLTKTVLQITSIKINNVYLWSDSQITLSWILSSPSRWPAFVANRVAEIQDNVPNAKWCYVNTKINPADCLSRGTDAKTLSCFPLWFHGPNDLSNPEFNPNPHAEMNVPTNEETSAVSLISTIQKRDDSFLLRFSSFNRAIRTTAYCLRFINNCKKPRALLKGELTNHEIHEATNRVIGLVQNVAYNREIALIHNNSPVNKDSNLFNLNPFLDHNKLLRVGGRLNFANVEFNQKHPIILPPHHVIQLLIGHEHQRLCHASPQAVLCSLRLNYWPMGGRRGDKKGYP